MLPRGWFSVVSGHQSDSDFQDSVVGSKTHQVSLFADEVCDLILLLWFIFYILNIFYTIYNSIYNTRMQINFLFGVNSVSVGYCRVI